MRWNESAPSGALVFHTTILKTSEEINVSKGIKTDKLNALKGGSVFMIGIGGCSMSGLAILLKSRGVDVSGYATRRNEYTEMLKKNKIRVFRQADPELLEGADLVIYWQGTKMDHELLTAAKEKGIPARSRSWLLGQLTEGYDRSICVCGTHGKTTVTSMLGQILIESGLDPAVHVGGFYPPMGGNIHIGNEELFITESCEFQKGFLNLRPTGIMLLNIDTDHLDCYRDIDEIEETFGAFLNKLPEDGWALGYGEDLRVLRQLRTLRCRTATYGRSAGCEYRMEKPLEDPQGLYEFDLYHDTEHLGHVRMKVPGMVNALNAVAALSAAHIMGVDASYACKIIGDFTGVRRRFERTGSLNGAEIYHDYGHNPVEMRNVLSIARKRCPNGRLWAVMQPHTYSRVKTLFEDYLTCTEEADITLVTDIYGAREENPGGIDSGMLAEGMKKHGINAVWTPSFKAAARTLRKGVQPGDLVITMGCGNINYLNDLLNLISLV